MKSYLNFDVKSTSLFKSVKKPEKKTVSVESSITNEKNSIKQETEAIQQKASQENEIQNESYVQIEKQESQRKLEEDHIISIFQDHLNAIDSEDQSKKYHDVSKKAAQIEVNIIKGKKFEQSYFQDESSDNLDDESPSKERKENLIWDNESCVYIKESELNERNKKIAEEIFKELQIQVNSYITVEDVQKMMSKLTSTSIKTKKTLANLIRKCSEKNKELIALSVKCLMDDNLADRILNFFEFVINNPVNINSVDSSFSLFEFSENGKRYCFNRESLLRYSKELEKSNDSLFPIVSSLLSDYASSIIPLATFLLFAQGRKPESISAVDFNTTIKTINNEAFTCYKFEKENFIRRIVANSLFDRDSNKPSYYFAEEFFEPDRIMEISGEDVKNFDEDNSNLIRRIITITATEQPFMEISDCKDLFILFQNCLKMKNMSIEHFFSLAVSQGWMERVDGTSTVIDISDYRIEKFKELFERENGNRTQIAEKLRKEILSKVTDTYRSSLQYSFPSMSSLMMMPTTLLTRFAFNGLGSLSFQSLLRSSTIPISDLFTKVFVLENFNRKEAPFMSIETLHARIELPLNAVCDDNRCFWSTSTVVVLALPSSFIKKLIDNANVTIDTQSIVDNMALKYSKINQFTLLESMIEVMLEKLGYKGLQKRALQNTILILSSGKYNSCTNCDLVYTRDMKNERTMEDKEQELISREFERLKILLEEVLKANNYPEEKPTIEEFMKFCQKNRNSVKFVEALTYISESCSTIGIKVIDLIKLQSDASLWSRVIKNKDTMSMLMERINHF